MTTLGNDTESEATQEVATLNPSQELWDMYQRGAEANEVFDLLEKGGDIDIADEVPLKHLLHTSSDIFFISSP